jgi:hypothetical protein
MRQLASRDCYTFHGCYDFELLQLRARLEIRCGLQPLEHIWFPEDYAYAHDLFDANNKHDDDVPSIAEEAAHHEMDAVERQFAHICQEADDLCELEESIFAMVSDMEKTTGAEAVFDISDLQGHFDEMESIETENATAEAEDRLKETASDPNASDDDMSPGEPQRAAAARVDEGLDALSAAVRPAEQGSRLDTAMSQLAAGEPHALDTTAADTTTSRSGAAGLAAGATVGAVAGAASAALPSSAEEAAEETAIVSQRMANVPLMPIETPAFLDHQLRVMDDTSTNCGASSARGHSGVLSAPHLAVPCRQTSTITTSLQAAVAKHVTQSSLEADAITGKKFCHRVTHVHVILANAVLASTFTIDDVRRVEMEGRCPRGRPSQTAGSDSAQAAARSPRRTGNAMALVLLSNVNAFLIKLGFPPLHDRVKTTLRDRVQRYRDRMLRRHDVAYLALQWYLRLPCRQGCHVAQLPPEKPDRIRGRECEHVEKVAARLRDEHAGYAAAAAKRRADLDDASRAHRGRWPRMGSQNSVVPLLLTPIPNHSLKLCQSKSERTPPLRSVQRQVCRSRLAFA